MLKQLFHRWFSKPASVEPEPRDRLEEEAEMAVLFNNDKKYSPSPGPVLTSVYRDLNEIHQACQIRGCVRPSAFTLMSTKILDTDLRFTSDNGRMSWLNLATSALPIYRQYILCDRHYDDEVRGQPGTAYVIGPSHVYNPEKHEETQRKLGLRHKGKIATYAS